MGGRSRSLSQGRGVSHTCHTGYFSYATEAWCSFLMTANPGPNGGLARHALGAEERQQSVGMVCNLWHPISPYMRTSNFVPVVSDVITCALPSECHKMWRFRRVRTLSVLARK